jgi:alpha-tubulin suppressor-like RCC1 family protein
MLPPIQSLAAGGQFSCASGAGGLLCWGANQHGQLGDNSFASSSTPQQPFGLGHGVRAISAGEATACALVDSGLRCWGADNAGQLGNNQVDVDSNVPVALPSLSQGVLGFASGPSANHACALVSGALQCWGTDSQGELGVNGALQSANAPLTVTVLTGLPTH